METETGIVIDVFSFLFSSQISALEAHKSKLEMELNTSKSTMSDNVTQLSELTTVVKQKEEQHHIVSVSIATQSSCLYIVQSSAL